MDPVPQEAIGHNQARCFLEKEERGGAPAVELGWIMKSTDVKTGKEKTLPTPFRRCSTW